MRTSSFKSSLLRASVVAAGVLVAAQTAQAQPQSQQDGGPMVGVGMICDSQSQAARFLELRASGKSADQAMATVNKEAHNKQACGFATIAFMRDATVDMRPVSNKLMQVVRISVVAGFNGKGWQRVTVPEQYAVVEAEGYSI